MAGNFTFRDCKMYMNHHINMHLKSEQHATINLTNAFVQSVNCQFHLNALQVIHALFSNYLHGPFVFRRMEESGFARSAILQQLGPFR